MDEPFLKGFLAVASNLEILQLDETCMDGGWLRTVRLQNLFEFRIHKPFDISCKNLSIFLQNHPKVKTFALTGSNVDIESTCDILTEYCKDLKTFECTLTVAATCTIR